MTRFMTSLLLCVSIAFFGGACDSSIEAPAEPSEQLEAEEAEPEPLATLSGTVSRTATIQEDGQGDLYVALFDSNPVSLDDSVTPTLVGRAILLTQDLVADDAAVDYLIEDVPPRSEPYFVITFFDDNGTTSDEDPSPDKGDLVSLDGFSAFQVLMDTPEHFEHDLVLNAVMPL